MNDVMFYYLRDTELNKKDKKAKKGQPIYERTEFFFLIRRLEEALVENYCHRPRNDASRGSLYAFLDSKKILLRGKILRCQYQHRSGLHLGNLSCRRRLSRQRLHRDHSRRPAFDQNFERAELGGL